MISLILTTVSSSCRSFDREAVARVRGRTSRRLVELTPALKV